MRHQFLAPTTPERATRRQHRHQTYDNLVDALGTRFVPPGSFVEDVRIPNRFNRLLLYTAAMIHSATAYFGSVLEDERMAAVFFWMGM
jgi:hypothetical protein